MKINLSTRSLAAVATLALAALGVSGPAQAADDVFWSLGLSSPGVQLGVGNAAPVVIQQPVYSQPYPVYSQPYPVYSQPYPVYRQPRPVYVAPQPIVYVRPAPVFISQPQYIQPDWRYRGNGRYWRNDRHDGGRDHDRGRHGGRGHDRDDD